METVTRSLSGLRVLVTEDNVVNQELARAILEGFGAAVGMASGGEQAIAKLNDQTWDVVLMDMQMAPMDGWQTIKLIRTADNRHRDVPIIAVTAHAMSGDRERVLSGGADGYLSKPFELLDLVNEILQQVKPNEVIANNPPVACDTCNEMAIMDWDRFGRATGNDQLRGCKIAVLFLDTIPSDIARVIDAINRRDWDAVHTESHGLKGACRSFGASRLGAIFDQIDLTANNQPENAASFLPEIASSWQSLETALTAYIAQVG